MYRTVYYVLSVTHASLFRLQQHEVVLPPDFECERCVLHIVRQAIEFGRFGFPDFDFWSCADIAIINSSSKTQVKFLRQHCSLVFPVGSYRWQNLNLSNFMGMNETSNIHKNGNVTT